MKLLLLLVPLLTLECLPAPPPKASSVQVQNTSPKIPKLHFLNSVAVFEDQDEPPAFCFDVHSTAVGPVSHEEEVIGGTLTVTDGDPCYKRFVTQRVYGQCIQNPRSIDEGFWVQEYVFFYVQGRGVQACLRSKGAWVPSS